MKTVLDIYVDADACPVKHEVYKVAKRHGLQVTLVSNSPLRIPAQSGIKLIMVDDQSDAADDWIVGHLSDKDIVITADIPLASRCLHQGARVVGPTGAPFTDANIGAALATRDLLSDLRGAGATTGGPPPFQQRDRSRFLHSLDQIILEIKRSA